MSQVIRTYSRKGKRVAKDASVSVDTSPDRSPVARKRQRIEVEVTTDNDGSDSDTEPKRRDGVEGEKNAAATSSISRGKHYGLLLLMSFAGPLSFVVLDWSFNFSLETLSMFIETVLMNHSSQAGWSHNAQKRQTALQRGQYVSYRSVITFAWLYWDCCA